MAFATVATVESSYEVYNKNPSANLDLSEWDLFTRGGSCGSGWLFVPALNALQKYGLCTESCYPYLTDELRCAGYSSQLVKIASWKQLNSLDEIKWWIANKGPVITGMEVYDDFFNYDSGIYSAAYGGFVGNHALSVVGFSDEGKYWICKNSWGTSWGESGWVRMSYTADTGFGSYGFYGVEFAGSPTPPTVPSIPSGPISGNTGTSYSYSTLATDPDGDLVKYTFDWGDGTTSTTNFVNSGKSASVFHKWTMLGTYQVKAMATDSKGAFSGWSSPMTLTIVGNSPPNTPSIPTGPVSGKVKTFYSYSTSATDPDGDQVKYTFDWGDGTKSVTSVVNAGKSASAYHKWTTFGTYQVRAMATDSKGASSGWSSPMNFTITAFTIAANSPLSTPSYHQITQLGRFGALKQAKNNKVKTTKMAGFMTTG